MPEVQITMCPLHAELASDIKDVKRALFGDADNGIVAIVQETRGAWHTVKWLIGVFGGSILVGLVLLFISYIEAPFKYAKTEDVRSLITQQSLLADRLGNVDDAMKDLIKELKRRP